MQINITSNIKDVSGKFKKVTDNIKDNRAIFAFASEAGYSDVINHFKNEESESGRWKGLSAVTIYRRRTRADKPNKTTKILQDQGNLRKNITRRYKRDVAEVGTNDIRAKTHQFGRGRIPKRTFIWLSDSARDRISANAIKHIGKF